MKKAVIFDLDGTLWDSREQVSEIWNQIYDLHPEVAFRLTGADIGKLMGKTTREIGRILFPDASETYRDAIMDECAGAENGVLIRTGAILFDGVREMLEQLSRNYDLYIVSNCQQGYEEAFLVSHRMKDVISDTETSGRTGKTKGENIRLIMERNWIAKAVYIGDTAGDEAAARFAGIPFIHAAYGFGRAEAPDAIARTPSEIVRLAEQFLK